MAASIPIEAEPNGREDSVRSKEPDSGDDYSTTTAGTSVDTDADWTLGVKTPEGQTTTFQIIPTKPDGNCMFRAISHAVFGNESCYDKCRRDIVDYISDDLHWPNFVTHIKGQNDHLVDKLKLRSDSKDTPEEDLVALKEVYRDYMFQDGTYGTLQEFIAASNLFHFNLIVLRQVSVSLFNILPIQDSVTWDTVHHFLFTGDTPDDGHFEYLQPTIGPGVSAGIDLAKGYYKVSFVNNDEQYVLMEQHFGPVPVPNDPGDDLSKSSEVSDEEIDINANVTSISTPGSKPAARIQLKRSIQKTSGSDSSLSGIIGHSVIHRGRVKARWDKRVYPSTSDSDRDLRLYSKHRYSRQGQRSLSPRSSSCFPFCCCFDLKRKT